MRPTLHLPMDKLSVDPQLATPTLDAHNIKPEEVIRAEIYEHWNTRKRFVIAHLKSGRSVSLKMEEYGATATAA